MIYLTVGNHCQGFDRLVRAADELVPEIGDRLIAQIGFSSYIPRNMEWVRFEAYQSALDHIKQAACIISHAGIGTIINAKKFNRPIVLVPRLKRYREHFSDHQMEIVTRLKHEGRGGAIVADPLEHLDMCVRKALDKQSFWRQEDFAGRAAIVAQIREFVDAIPV